jgi:hypothetical protein
MQLESVPANFLLHELAQVPAKGYSVPFFDIEAIPPHKLQRPQSTFAHSRQRIVGRRLCNLLMIESSLQLRRCPVDKACLLNTFSESAKLQSSAFAILFLSAPR